MEDDGAITGLIAWLLVTALLVYVLWRFGSYIAAALF